MQYKTIVLKPKKEESLNRHHPWIFSGAIKTLPEGIEEGEIVKVLSAGNDFLAIGHYQIGSIAVRVLSFVEEEISENFWLNKLQDAYNQRRSLGLINPTNNAYRLVFGEGDNLPGLIIDIYANTAVVQAHSIGMHINRQFIANALLKVCEGVVQNVYYKSETTLPFKAELAFEDGYLIKNTDESKIALENGLKFVSDWSKGQKTGFFLDQRDNRSLLEHYSANKRVLNMFCYTGGFSFYAMRGNAELVHSVDSSSRAIKLTDENIALNFSDTSRHESFAEDAFKFLSRIEQDAYDLIILDPPAFAKHRGAIKNAILGYKRINHAALAKIQKGGILFTFSCSQAISKDQFRTAIFAAALQAGRKVKILHQLTQPADHPINIFHPEGEYLKGLVLYVE